MRVDAQTRPWLRTPKGSYRYIKADYLEKVVSGFQSGKPTIIMVTSLRTKLRTYHSYTGGPNWIARLARRQLGPGETHAVELRIPTESDFTGGLGGFALSSSTFRFQTVRPKVEGFSLADCRLEIRLCQDPGIEGITSFHITGKVVDGLRCVGGVASLRFQMEDFFGRKCLLSVYHNGHGKPFICIKANHGFYRIESAYFDGVRVGPKFHYRRSNPNVVTIYFAPPSGIYHVVRVFRVRQNFLGVLAGDKQIVADLFPLRKSDRFVLMHGRKYDIGRVGAEIAYTIATEVLALRGIILNEPSKGGKDLFTKDGRVVLQTRLLTRTRNEGVDEFEADLRREMSRLIRKLEQDFRYGPTVERGYAILTYLGHSPVLRSMVVEVKSKVGPPGFEPGATPAIQ